MSGRRDQKAAEAVEVEEQVVVEQDVATTAEQGHVGKQAQY